MKKIYFFALLGLVASSCATSKLTTKSTNAKKHEIEASYNGMVSKPLLADLSIENKRKEVTYEGMLNLPMADLKLNAKQLFLETHSCDYIVDPIYSTTVVKENLKTKEVTIKLTGLPAKYSNIYQVDSLPKSIGQFYALDKPIERVDYLNSVEEFTPRIGTDLTFGSKGLIGLQLDYLLKNEKLRGYISYEYFNKMNSSFDLEVSDTSSVGTQVTGNSSSSHTFSLGVMKEYQLINRVKLRGQAGLNCSLFDDVNINSPYGEINAISRLGIRLGAAIDIKLYRGISFLVKGHSNVNFLSIYAKDPNPNTTLKVKKFVSNGVPVFNLGFGLRFVF